MTDVGHFWPLCFPYNNNRVKIEKVKVKERSEALEKHQRSPCPLVKAINCKL
jgi:hypothetical protein